MSPTELAGAVAGSTAGSLIVGALTWILLPDKAKASLREILQPTLLLAALALVGLSFLLTLSIMERHIPNAITTVTILLAFGLVMKVVLQKD